MGEKRLDCLDFKLLELLLSDSRLKVKEIGKRLNIDERMVARRMEQLVEEGVITKFTIEVDWKKLGFTTVAYSNATPILTEPQRSQLFAFFSSHPRIVNVESTVGANEYILYTICEDIQMFTERISRPLETMNVGLSTSIVSNYIKHDDYLPLLKIASESYPPLSRKRNPRQKGKNKNGQ
jgi:Lrp/AsnC family leucine-responsive transcriptional regulator